MTEKEQNRRRLDNTDIIAIVTLAAGASSWVLAASGALQIEAGQVNSAIFTITEAAGFGGLAMVGAARLAMTE